MADTDFKVDVKGLENLIKELGFKKEVQVGVFDDVRSAQVGLKHEFGDPTTNLPMRSFLTAPIFKKQHLIQGAAQKSLDSGDVDGMYKEIAILAESIVDEAFETKGYGEWAELTPRAIASKSANKDKILIDTGQLRNSIKAKVVKL